ncbi:hypothetical protein [Sphingosinicella sp.]|uniref:hypothetical protein n=1 Tax=Sphingosinicella sp. TaxID=1917971 RepID=UPI0040383940
MTTATNLATLQSAYAGWSSTKGGNVAEIIDMFDETVEMRSALSPDVPDAVAGVHMNRAGAQAYFDGLLRDWEMLSYDVEKFVGQGPSPVPAMAEIARRRPPARRTVQSGLVARTSRST